MIMTAITRSAQQVANYVAILFGLGALIAGVSFAIS
jgi:hypothetical protein